MPLQGNLSVERMCDLVPVSRAGFYRYLQPREPDQEEMAVRAAIQEVALQHRRRYGCRRITAELRQRGMRVNRKRVLRIMREDDLLAIRRRKYVQTTDSDCALDVYLNLASRMSLNGPNQLWVADITYIRLKSEFVYLAVILDAYSRRVVGWALDRKLRWGLTANALQQAIRQRQPQPGLVHHSDQGFQYRVKPYIELLQKHKIISSMSRPANPFDNARCESFIKTLKQEEIYAHCYRDLRDLETHILDFIENYYNRCRLHSALSYQTPEQFEHQTQTGSRLGATLRLSGRIGGMLGDDPVPENRKESL